MRTTAIQLPLNIVRFRYALILLVGLVLADGLVTQYLIGVGAAWEGNPILRFLLANGDFMRVKLGGSLLSVVLLTGINVKQPRTAKVTSWLFIALYTLIVYWNIAVVFIYVLHQ